MRAAVDGETVLAGLEVVAVGPVQLVAAPHRLRRVRLRAVERQRDGLRRLRRRRAPCRVPTWQSAVPSALSGLHSILRLLRLEQACEKGPALATLLCQPVLRPRTGQQDRLPRLLATRTAVPHRWSDLDLLLALTALTALTVLTALTALTVLTVLTALMVQIAATVGCVGVARTTRSLLEREPLRSRPGAVLVAGRGGRGCGEDGGHLLGLAQHAFAPAHQFVVRHHVLTEERVAVQLGARDQRVQQLGEGDVLLRDVQLQVFRQRIVGQIQLHFLQLVVEI